MQWYIAVLKKYAVFSGRARRMECWMFALISWLAVLAFSMVDVVTGTYHWGTSLGALSTLYSLAVLIPTLAVTVRRLHDTDRSGWWIFLSLIPLLGAIAVLFFLISDGTPGPNRYGPNPKESAAMPPAVGAMPSGT
jgi:uncharacterized membrane protein YhaH (DUF805 family)